MADPQIELRESAEACAYELCQAVCIRHLRLLYRWPILPWGAECANLGRSDLTATGATVISLTLGASARVFSCKTL